MTFIECNNDINSMIDIGKIADLVLLMIDGSFGFEMVSAPYSQRKMTLAAGPLPLTRLVIRNKWNS